MALPDLANWVAQFRTDWPDPPKLAHQTKTRDAYYVNHAGMRRPWWCAGGQYVSRSGEGLTLRRVQCNREAVFPLALCEACSSREQEAHEQLANMARKADEGAQVYSRTRYTR